MKMKSLLLVTLASLGLTASTMAQNLPNYVPANGLVGWWPFNGNANDESGNNNNGNNNGAILTTDRFNNSNCAFDFNNCNYIDVGMSSANFSNSNFTISLWFTRDSSQIGYLISKRNSELFANFWQMRPNGFSINETTSNDSGFVAYNSSLNQWYNYIVIRDGIELKLFVNGILQDSISTNTILNLSNNTTIKIGAVIAPISGLVGCHYGKIDDIGIWNRSLTHQEITDLYSGNICYQTITVTDTLLINMGIITYNPITYNNTIKIFPNPANNHITIDYGNFATLNGYQLIIENSLGQQVFQTNITQQTDYLSLNNWGGNGLYFVHIIDAQGNTIDIRKIVLQ